MSDKNLKEALRKAKAAEQATAREAEKQAKEDDVGEEAMVLAYKKSLREAKKKEAET